MAIVRRWKRSWYPEGLKGLRYEEVVKISLNKYDKFEFDLPKHYVDAITQSKTKPDILNARIRNGKVEFSSLDLCDRILATMNNYYKETISTLNEERVLILKLECDAIIPKDNHLGYSHIGRRSWNNDMGGTFLSFDYGKYIKVVDTIYPLDNGIRGEFAGQWKRGDKPIRLVSAYRESEALF